MKKILVIGSLNMDSVIEISRMPQSGETISGKSITLNPGGKGANQAYAAGKLGGDVAMIGAVGQDDFGKQMYRNLQSVHVNTEGILTASELPTGQAYILLNEKGENSIIIIAGANQTVTPALLKEHLSLIQDCDIVMMQLEIPLETVYFAKDIALQYGKTVILDPAPAVAGLPTDFWNGIHYVKPNETELALLTGMQANTREQAVLAAHTLLQKGVENVILTLGSKGSLLVNAAGETFFEALPVNAVDTTAAGDCFLAAFAVALSAGNDVSHAIRYAGKASAIAVTRKGAQASIPSPEELL